MRTVCHRCFAVFVLATLSVVLPAVSAQREQSIREGRECLRTGGYQWYDGKRDAPAAFLPEEQKNENRLRKLHDWFSVAFNLVVLAVIGVGLMSLAYWLWKLGRRTTGTAASATRVRALVTGRPDQPSSGTADLDFLRASEQAAQAGDFRTAIVYLFNYQLVLLDQRNLIRLHPGVSNGQYLRELTDVPVRRVYQRCTTIFEAVFYGARPADAAVYARFSALDDELRQAIAPQDR